MGWLCPAFMIFLAELAFKSDRLLEPYYGINAPPLQFKAIPVT